MAFRLRPQGPDTEPIWRRIDAGVRAAIEAGQLRPGDRLPSVADVAKDLGVARLTVVKAFRELEDAGLVTAHVGRGTFVADGRTTAGASREGGPRRPPPPSHDRAPAGSDPSRTLRRIREGYARSVRDLMRLERRPGTIDLTGGVPDPTSVPEGLLERLTSKVLAVDPRRLYGYGGETGLLELRTAIARTLSRTGVDVDPRRVVVTNGSQQAISLVAAWAREDDRSILCETPTYSGVPNAFHLFGQAVASVPWDDDGLPLDALRAAAAPGTRPLLYTCPDHQNPTGRTMTLQRRRELAAWAAETGAVVLEDAIFRDLHFDGTPVESLYGLLPVGQRVLVGSVSKSFMPGLRIGFLVADEALLEALKPAKRTMDVATPPLVQAVAAAFLDDGFEAHVAEVRADQRARRDVVIAALEAEMPEGTTWTRPDGGFQLWVTLPEGTSALDLFLRGLAHGVAIGPGPAHDMDGRYTTSFRLGYARGTLADLGEGVRRLARALEDLRQRRGSDAASAGSHV